MQSLILQIAPAIVLEVNPAMLAARGDSAVTLLSRFSHENYEIYRICERPGLLQGGRVRLERVNPIRQLDFCDVLCFPKERQNSGAFV